MTAIVGLVDDGEVWMGADSAGVAGLSLVVRKDPKVFISGPFIVGFTSSFRMGQILRFGESGQRLDDAKFVRDLQSITDPWEAMVSEVVPWLRKAFKSAGYAETENGKEWGGTFLIGYRGRLFQVEGDFQVGESSHGFDAVGCGQEMALGSLHTSRFKPDWGPQQRVRTALEAAQEFSAGVRGPFTILKLEKRA